MPSIDPVFLIFEIIMYILFILCIIHAWKRSPRYVAELFGGLLFGLILEYINAHYIADYRYGQFLFMILDIPVCIGMGWAVIIYTAMALSDRIGLNVWTRPLADALMALNIDLAMDAVAIRIGSGMWVWGWDKMVDRWTIEWFGVPFGNFFGWFFVVLLYSAFVRTGRLLITRFVKKALWNAVFPFLAVIVSEICLSGLLQLFIILWYRNFPGWILFAVPIICAIILLIFFGKPKPGDKPGGIILTLVPMAFHIYFLLVLFFIPLTAWTPWLIPISLVMFLISIGLHLYVLKRKIIK